MNRERFSVAATLLFTGVFAVAALPAAAQAPQLNSVLAGKKLTPPIRGEAQLQVVWPPVTKRDKDVVVTRFMVKNVSSAPIARLAIDIPWYDKGGAVVAGGKGVVNLIQPNEVQTVLVETQYNAKMLSNNYQFSHVNGTIKVVKVAKLEVPKEPAATPAAAKK
jgi:hypothetical protein